MLCRGVPDRQLRFLSHSGVWGRSFWGRHVCCRGIVCGTAGWVRWLAGHGEQGLRHEVGVCCLGGGCRCCCRCGLQRCQGLLLFVEAVVGRGVPSRGLLGAAVEVAVGGSPTCCVACTRIFMALFSTRWLPCPSLLRGLSSCVLSSVLVECCPPPAVGRARPVLGHSGAAGPLRLRLVLFEGGPGRCRCPVVLCSVTGYGRRRGRRIVLFVVVGPCAWFGIRFSI